MSQFFCIAAVIFAVAHTGHGQYSQFQPQQQFIPQQQPQQWQQPQQYQQQQQFLQQQPQQQIYQSQQGSFAQQAQYPTLRSRKDAYGRVNRRYVPPYTEQKPAFYNQQQQVFVQQLQFQAPPQQFQQFQQVAPQQYQPQIQQQFLPRQQIQFQARPTQFQLQQVPRAPPPNTLSQSLPLQQIPTPSAQTQPTPIEKPQYQPQVPQQQPQPIPARKVFREQPHLVQQQVKQPFVAPQQQQRRPAPQTFNPPKLTAPRPTQSRPRTTTHAPVHAPPPPEKFIPYASDVFTPLDGKIPAPEPRPQRPVTVINTDTSLPAGEFESDLVNGGSDELLSSIEEISNIDAQTPPPPPPQTPAPQQLRPAQHKRPQHVHRQPPPAPVQAPVQRPQQRKKTKPAPAPTSVLQTTMVGGDDMNPNDVFLQCCKTKKVHAKCESRCNFDIMNKKILTGMFLGTDPCPQSYGRDLMSCAAQERDHSECCRSKGVHLTKAGDKCLGFCDMTPGNSFQADVSFLPCWAVLNDIKHCFREYIEEH